MKNSISSLPPRVSQSGGTQQTHSDSRIVVAEVSKHRHAHGTQGRLPKEATFVLRHSFNRCLLSAYYAPGTILGTGDLSENKTNTNTLPLGTYISVRGKRAIPKIKNETLWVSDVVINAGGWEVGVWTFQKGPHEEVDM